MLNEKIRPENALENAVINMDNSAIVDFIAGGAELTRPHILATREAFDLRYPVAVLLLESSPCLREEGTVKCLEELNADSEMVDLVRELGFPLPENSHPQHNDLLTALEIGDHASAAELIFNEGVTLSSVPADFAAFLEELPEFLIEAIFDRALEPRCKAQLFLTLREAAKDCEKGKKRLLLEVMQLSMNFPDTPERAQQLHALWKKHTTTPFISEIESEPEKFSDEFLADLIIDQELDFDVRPFKAFAPFYQALMLNNGAVDLEQFDEEAEIEKFDAKAVFELLRYSDEYAGCVDWELVNKTANASEILEFLGKHPQYADKADWQMINVQGSAEDWLAFLKEQPRFLAMYQGHTPLYLCAPDLWEEIFAASGIPHQGLWACLKKNSELPLNDLSEWELLCKIKACSDEPQFFEVNDIGTCQWLENIAEECLSEFVRILQEGTGEERFVKIIR